MRVGFIGAGRMGRPWWAVWWRPVMTSTRWAGASKSAAAGGSVGSFTEVAGDFVAKDVAVVRGIAAELGDGLGALDDVIEKIDIAKSIRNASVLVFPVRHEGITVSVTVRDSAVKVQPNLAAEEDSVTKPKVVFDPYAEDYFNNPFDIYRRMREEAPLYYDEKEDFYALTRHEDVAAAFKDFETYSSARGCDLAMVRRGIAPEQKSIIFMDPPEHRHMRSLLNKAFTPRAIQSQRETIIEVIDKYLGAVDSDNFDVVQDFSGPFPVEVITRMAGVPEEYRQQVRHWIDTSLHHDPGQIEISEVGMQANIDTAMYYFSLVQERRQEPQEDMISRLIAAEIPGEDGELRKLDDIEICGFATLLGGAGAETVTKLMGNAAVIFANHPDQWQKLQEDRDKIPGAVEELLRYEGPVQYNVRYTLKEAHVSGGVIPAGKPVFLCGAAANRDPEAFTDADTFDIERDQTEAQHLGLGYGIHSCLGAALARLESRIALERLLDFMPRYEVDWAGCKRVNMQNVAGWKNVPVKVLR